MTWERAPTNHDSGDIPPIIRHIFRSERSCWITQSRPQRQRPTCGILAELERYPELRH